MSGIEEQPLGRWDAWQRRHPVVAVPLAVVYKFFDDQGVYLAVIITYYAFVAVVPLLLLATSVLGFLLRDDPELRARVVESAVSNFPVVGDQLGRPEGLQGSTGAVLIGAVLALYGALGLGMAVQNALHTVWAVPRNSRPNPVLVRVQALGLLVVGGLSLIALSAVATLAQVASDQFSVLGDAAPVLVPAATFVVMVGVLMVLLREGGGRRHTLRGALPGAVLIAGCWHLVQWGSTSLVQQRLQQASSMNQTFGLVLGLIGVAYLLALALVLGMETNVVLHRNLWPRALLTPFTDAVELTRGDRRAYAGYARAQRHKGFEAIAVRFRARRSPVPSSRPAPSATDPADHEKEKRP
ncbi:MAG: YihY/virulence factor BrkB family protein [Propionibacteriales bacterium]|nr:YihY/virulence factor BrkB family protein [Propionibacteriales bacterium]